MSKPRVFRKRCRTCGAAFSGKKLATVNAKLAGHDCRAEQLKRERTAATNAMFNRIIQGAMIGMFGQALAGGLGPITGPDSKGIYHAMPKGAILPPPAPGGKRTKNPLFRGHGKSRRRPVEKGRRKPPSE
jgi:hypothetical protein